MAYSRNRGHRADARLFDRLADRRRRAGAFGLIPADDTLDGAAKGRSAAFLDRDGVINIDTGYLHRPEDMRFTSTAAEGITLLNAAGYLVVVVTNQSGVARGYYTLADLDRLHAAMQEALARQGARIDAFYACPFHPAGTVAAFAREHPDRKPAPGMILRAMDDLSIRRVGSFLIGDKPRDIEAARRAGLPGILVPTDRCDLAEVVRSVLRDGPPAAPSAVGDAPTVGGRRLPPALNRP